MTIIDVRPLDLVVINSHCSCTSHRTSGAACSIGAGILLLPIQERVGWIECWIRPISTVLSQRSDAPISILVPVRTRCGCTCIRVRRGETAISGRLLRLVLALPSTGRNQWLHASIPIRGSGWLLGSPPAGFDLNWCRSHDERCARG